MFFRQQSATRFLAAPPSVSSVVGALLEPVVAGGCWFVLHRAFNQPFEGPSVAVLLLATVMLFPGVNRLGVLGIGVAIDIVLSWMSVASVLGLLGYATRRYHDFPAHMLVSWVLVTPLVLWVLTRAITSIMLRMLQRPRNARPAVVVGAGPLGLRVAGVIEARTHLGWQLLGLFDDRHGDRLDAPAVGQLLGPVKALPAFIEGRGVRDVFVTLPLSSQPRIVQLMDMLQNTTASVHYVPDVFGANIAQGRLEDMGGLPVVSLYITPYTGINRVAKRVSDIALAIGILLLVAPVMLAVAVGVKLSSPGPVIFRQRRTGLDGETIWVYKFRSMVTLEDGPVVRQSTRSDERVTSFGRFIRRTSLDELPQLVNVLQGRMSVVGPRPHALAHNDYYRTVVRAYMARHKVRPGITGWAQVNGFRGETDTLDKMERRIEYDLEYLRNWSLGLDLLIIARTVKQLFFNRDVY